MTWLVSFFASMYRKSYLFIIPLLCAPLTWALIWILNTGVDSSIHSALDESLASNNKFNIATRKVAEALTTSSLVDISSSKGVDYWTSKTKNAVINIILYDSHKINEIDDYHSKDRVLNPLISKPSLSDSDIVEQLREAFLKNKTEAQFKDFMRQVMANNYIADIRESVIEIINSQFYMRRILNGEIQALTLYFTLLAFGFWLVAFRMVGRQLTLLSKRSSLYKTSDNVNSPQFFIRRNGGNCRVTNPNDGFDKVPVSILSSSVKEVDKLQHSDREIGQEFNSYKKEIRRCVDMLENAGSELDYSPFHIIQVIIGRAELNGLVDDCVMALSEQIDFFHQRLERTSSFFSYWIWLIPTIGFVGTIYGISGALQNAHTVLGAEDALKSATTQGLTATLGIAFDTTLLALICSVPLMFLMKLQEWKTDYVVNSVQRIINERVISGLQNAHSTNERINQYSEIMRQHMDSLKEELLTHIARIFVANQFTQVGKNKPDNDHQ